MRTLLLLTVLFFSYSSSFSNADEICYQNAIRIIVGEASNQGLKGMICVGEVLRRRGSVKGFYGIHNANLKTEPEHVWKLAEKAWVQSASTNFTKGADHFDNVRAFGEPWWAKYCIKTYEYKDHVFYKEVNKKG